MSEHQEMLLQWASENVRQPWEQMVRAAAAVAAGEALPDDLQQVNLPLTPFQADYRVLYPLLRNFGGLLTWSPNNLFTIILDEREETILRAYLEVTRDHNFIEMIPVSVDEPFLVEALTILRSGDLYPLRRHLDEACRDRFKHRVNWVKVANIGFFGAFQENLAAFESSGDLWDWTAGALRAVQKVYDRKWIRFAPEPPVFARLREMFNGIIQFDPSHIDPAALFGAAPLDRPAPRHTIVLLKDADRVTGLSLGGERPTEITLDPKITDQLAGVPFARLAKTCARITGVNRVIVLRFEPVANLLYEAFYHPMPYQREDSKIVLRRAMEIVRRFREQWHMHPLPFYLTDPIRLPAKWLGNPYDINYLATWFLPGMILDGERVFLGQHNVRTFVTLQEQRILAMYTLEIFDTGIRKVITHDPSQYADLFADVEPTPEAMKECAVQLGIRLWKEGHGFQNQVTITQKDFLATLGEVGSQQVWKSPLSLWRIVRPIRNLIRMAKQGALVTYPDLMFESLEKWVKQVGRVHIYSSLITVPFDRKRPRSRGLKYVRASLLAAGFVVTVAYLWLR